MSNAARKQSAHHDSGAQDLESFLLSEGYSFLVPDGPKYFYGLMPMAFTWGLFCKLEWSGYSHRYCYHTQLEALGAYKDWAAKSFEGEPKGFIKRKPELYADASVASTETTQRLS